MDNDENFVNIYDKCKPYTLTSKQKMYTLYKAVQYVIKGGIQGDMVECGVGRGGSVMAMAYALSQMGVTNRKIYLYDTYEGMTEPSDIDTDIKGNKLNKFYKACLATIEDVKDNVYSTGYPEENFILVKGKVEDTLPVNIPRSVSLLRLNTDWYESTYNELLYLYPKLSENGIFIVDEYGCWMGQQKAVDKYFSENGVNMFLSRVDTGGRMGVKTR